MNIKPLGDRVVIKLLETEETQKAVLSFRFCQGKTTDGRSSGC